MRVEQRGEDILHHDQETDPVGEPVASEEEQVQEPHCVKHYNTDTAPLHRDVECLVVGISNHLAAGLVGSVRGDALKKASRRARAVANQRRLGKEAERLAPEFNAEPD